MKTISTDILKFRKLKNSQEDAFFNYKQLFKDSELDLSSIAKTALAMANAIGGRIWIGLKIEKSLFVAWEDKPQNWPSNDIVKTLINSHIKPQIAKLDIEDFGGNLLITVPQSASQPHMFENYKYYKRVLSKNVLMEEFEIRQLYQISKKSDLQIISISNLQGIPHMSGGLYSSMKFYPRVHIQNLGQRLEDIYKLELALPSALVDESFSVLHKYLKGYEKDKNIYSIPSTEPLFQNEIKTMIELVLKVDTHNFDTFLKSEINLKLYSSEQVHEQNYWCREWFHYQGSLPQIESFTKKTEE